MVDDEKEGDVIPPRGADWEVVSLTASTYAATPDPTGFDPNDDDSGSRQEASSVMFMSDHFVFPPSEHENLPIEPDSSEIHYISEDKTVISAVEGEEERHDKLDDDPQGTEIFDDGSTFSARGLEFEEGKGLQGMYSIPYPESTETANPSDSPDQDFSSPHKNTKSSDGDNYEGSGHPCAAWWKKNALSLYHQAKEANTFWSIFVAAALTGLVILGKRWHQDKWHTPELRRHLSINEEEFAVNNKTMVMSHPEAARKLHAWRKDFDKALKRIASFAYELDSPWDPADPSWGPALLPPSWSRRDVPMLSRPPPSPD